MAKISQIAILILCTTVLSGVALALPIANFSFEAPTTASFIYNPIDPTPGGWTFLGRSGVAANTFFAPPPPDGVQAAFLQQFVDQPSSLSSIAESLSGVSLSPATLVFLIAQRPGFAPNPFSVFYGAQNLGTFTPASTSFQTITINFTPSATSGVLMFRSAATTNGDLDTAIDKVSFAQGIPEPVSILLTGGGLIALALVLRRRLA
jgi:hypothetical protein